MEQKKIIGRIYIPDFRTHVHSATQKNMRLLVEFDWRDIKEDTDVWESIAKKYDEELKRCTTIRITPISNYVPFRRNITPEEALQILRLVRAKKARIGINAMGLICQWKLLREPCKPVVNDDQEDE